jgi:hypothetical protein
VVASIIAKLEIAVAGFKVSPKKNMSRGIAIAPPPTPPIVLTPLKTTNTNTPPHSYGNWGKTGLCTHALLTHT